MASSELWFPPYLPLKRSTLKGAQINTCASQCHHIAREGYTCIRTRWSKPSLLLVIALHTPEISGPGAKFDRTEEVVTVNRHQTKGLVDEMAQPLRVQSLQWLVTECEMNKVDYRK